MRTPQTSADVKNHFSALVNVEHVQSLAKQYGCDLFEKLIEGPHFRTVALHDTSQNGNEQLL